MLAWRLRISDPPLLCVCIAGLEEEEKQRSRRSALAKQPPDPGTSLRLHRQSSPRTYPLRLLDRLSVRVPDLAARGASPSCSGERANVSGRSRGKPSAPARGTREARAGSSPDAGDPLLRPRPLLPLPGRREVNPVCAVALSSSSDSAANPSSGTRGELGDGDRFPALARM